MRENRFKLIGQKRANAMNTNFSAPTRHFTLLLILFYLLNEFCICKNHFTKSQHNFPLNLKYIYIYKEKERNIVQNILKLLAGLLKKKSPICGFASFQFMITTTFNLIAFVSDFFFYMLNARERGTFIVIYHVLKIQITKKKKTQN